MSSPQLWRGISSLGNVSLRHMSNTELLKNIIIFKFCSFKTCVEFITKNAFNPLIKHAVRMTVFPHFCSGEEAEDAKALALKLQKNGVQTIIDHSVEELESPDAFKLNLENKLSLILSLKNSSISAAGRGDGLNYIPLKPTALISPQLLEKITALLAATSKDISICNNNVTDLLSKEDKALYDSGLINLSTVIAAARDSGCCILLDAEQSNRQPAIDSIARTLAQNFNLPGKPPVVYNTYQTYLKSSNLAIKRDLQHALENNYVFALKLVRGAYMVSEAHRAALACLSCSESPLHPTKDAVDSSYNTNAVEIIETIAKSQRSGAGSLQESSSSSLSLLSVAPYIFIATHNSNSVDICINSMIRLGIAPSSSNIKFAQIMGMSDHITYALSLNQFNSYKLVCFGKFSQVYPWLIRRLQENQDIFGAMQSDRNLLWRELQRRMNYNGIG